MHSSAQAVAQYAERAHIRQLVLTHFSARYHRSALCPKDADRTGSVGELAEEAQRYYTAPLYLANDFDHFSLDNEGKLHRSSLRVPS